MSKEIVERLREIVLKNRHHVELSPGVGEDVQRYGIAVCDDILSDIERLAEQEAVPQTVRGITSNGDSGHTGSESAGTALAHTDHPLRHYDRTCPACQAEQPTAQLEPWFRVEVTDSVGQVVAIESEALSGRDIGEVEEASIHRAIDHLSAFIGNRRARPVPVREEVIEIDEYGKVTNAPSRINIPRKTLQEIIAALYRKDNADSHELAAELQAMHDAATGGKHE